MNENSDIKKLFGRKIKELRTKRGYTQEHLAELIGVCERNLSKIECGCNFVTADTLSKILSALCVKPKELFDFEHNQEKENLKQELLKAITNETIDINLMYRFYEAIKQACAP